MCTLLFAEQPTGIQKALSLSHSSLEDKTKDRQAEWGAGSVGG